MSESLLYILLVGSLVAIACAQLGSYLVLRKMAMVGDAISHAVLPGIVAAFLITESRDPVTMIIGAGAVGLLSTIAIELFSRMGKLQTDASIGVTFTFLFALGIIMISLFSGPGMDIDQECVLYGEIELVSIDLWSPLPFLPQLPRQLWIMGPVALMVTVFVHLAKKELFASSFDASFAQSVGMPTQVWHYVLMTVVSFTSVAAFESVGAVMVVAFLIVPAATAWLLANSMRSMIIIACVVGVAAIVTGTFSSTLIDSSVSATSAVAAGLFFVLAAFVAKWRSKPAS